MIIRAGTNKNKDYTFPNHSDKPPIPKIQARKACFFFVVRRILGFAKIGILTTPPEGWKTQIKNATIYLS